MSTSSLEALYQKLSLFRQKYYYNQLFKGIFIFLSIGLLYFLGILSLEYFLWLPTELRTLCFWSALIVMCVLLVKYIVIPILNLLNISKHALSQEMASKIIGRHFPEIGDQLLNVLQLSDQVEKETHSDLLLASIEQKAKHLQLFNFRQAIDYKKAFSYAKYLVLPFCLFALIALFNGITWFKTPFQRVVAYNQYFEAPAPFYFSIKNNQLSGLQGADFTLNVSTYGALIPDKMAIHFDQQTYFLRKDSLNAFSYTFKGLQKDVAFYLSSVDQKSKEYILKTQPTPSIQKFTMQVIAPKYTQIASKTYLGTGNALIPEGALVSWKVQSKYSDTICMQFAPIDLIESKKQQPCNVFNKSDKGFEFQKRIKKPVTYQVSSSNNYVSSYENLEFELETLKDKAPDIKVVSKKDTLSIARELYYGQISDDYGLSKLQLVYYPKNTPNDLRKLPITFDNGVFSEFVFAFPNPELKLEESTVYEFYFEVWDNDGIHGHKSSKSSVFGFQNRSEIQIEQLKSEKETQSLSSFSTFLEDRKERKSQMESFMKLQNQNAKLNFREKREFKDLLEQKIADQKQFSKLSEKLKKTLEKRSDKNENKALKKQLDKVDEQVKENKKLIDELKKALENLSEKELNEKVKELDKSGKKTSKNLNQVLQLTKRHFVIEKHQKVVQMIELLSKKQLELSSTLTQKQDQTPLFEDWKVIVLELDALRKLNAELKQSMKLDDDPRFEQKITDEFKLLEDQFELWDKTQVQKNQKALGIMLQTLADKMLYEDPSGGGGMGMKQLKEDTKTLRQILDNLVLFSMGQEQNMQSFSGLNTSSPNYSMYVKKQNLLKEHFTHIDDSLYALSSRNPEIGTVVNDLIADVGTDMNDGLNRITDNQTRNGVTFLNYALKASNDLALLLSEKMGFLNQQMKPGKGEGGEPQEGFQLPDIIKKQKSLSEDVQEMLSKAKKESGNKEGTSKEQNAKEKGEQKNSSQEGQSSTSKQSKESKGEQSGGKQPDGKKQGEGSQSGGKSSSNSQKKGSKPRENTNDTNSQKEGGKKEGQKGDSSESGKQGTSQKNKKGSSDTKDKGTSKGQGKGASRNKKDADSSKKKSEGSAQGEKNNGQKEGSGTKNNDSSSNKNAGNQKKSTGKGDHGNTPNEKESDYGQLFKIYKEQQQLRNQLEDVISKEKMNPEVKRILDEMKKTEGALIQNGATPQTLQRMNKIKHQLFKLSEAQFRQGEDSKREAKSVKKQLEMDQKLTPNQIKKYFNTTEILNRHSLPLKPNYSKLVKQYFAL